MSLQGKGEASSLFKCCDLGEVFWKSYENHKLPSDILNTAVSHRIWGKDEISHPNVSLFELSNLYKVQQDISK